MQESKPRKFLQQYSVIIAILIGAWIIGMSIIAAGLLIVRHLDGNTVSGIQKVDLELAENDRVIGDSNAPVTIVEYADFQCPYCKGFHDTVLTNLKTSYIDSGLVKFVFRDFAFLGQESFDAAEAARCAQDQGKFWEYHDHLYTNQGAENVGVFSVAALKGYASALGLDQAKFDSCLDSHGYKDEVDTETQAGQGYGVNSTPTVFVNGVMYEGLLDPANYQAIIETALTEANESRGGILNRIESLFR